jgi:hypothetical protein
LALASCSGLREIAWVYKSNDPCRWQYFVYIYYLPVAGMPNIASEQPLRSQAL